MDVDSVAKTRKLDVHSCVVENVTYIHVFTVHTSEISQYSQTADVRPGSLHSLLSWPFIQPTTLSFIFLIMHPFCYSFVGFIYIHQFNCTFIHPFATVQSLTTTPLFTHSLIHSVYIITHQPVNSFALSLSFVSS